MAFYDRSETRDGALYKAVTRGNGEIGEGLPNNAESVQNIPQ